MDIKYNSQASEEKLLKAWESQQTYSPTNNPGPLFSIDTPPPTVSGSLHIGHIFSYTQTDIIARYKRLSGYSVFYPFGFDDNGLPTERYVEKKCDVRPEALGRSNFIKLCLEQTKDVEQEFKALWQKIGLSVDWNYWYSTISEDSRRLSQLSFIKLYNDGFIYRKDEPALYCTTCRTTVAQAELDDIEAPSFFNDIIFKDEEGNNLIIATTRPELLYSTSALLFHPSDERYKHLNGKKAYVPIYNLEVPIFTDEAVNPEKGSGLVMVSTFGDQQDIAWFKKYKLPLRLSFGRDGKWLEATGPLHGLKAHDARKKIIELLKEHNLLLNQRPISHAVNVHERCKKEIEYIVLPQWFVNILDHKQTFIELADQVNWHPTFMKSRYIDWVSNLKWDWCISRQRFYGIPFPAWHCTGCNTVFIANEKQLPLDPQEAAYQGTCSCGKGSIVPDTDVMDTWNTSSITPYICSNLLNPSQDPFSNNTQFIPMSMRPQAHDIIRTWAFDTIVKAWMHNKTIPWKDIVISGHVLSSAKEKISKSQGNNPLDPNNLITQHSADVIRFWTASGSLGQDISFSETQLKIGKRLVTKLWNACKFSEPHLINFVPGKQPEQFGMVNEWILDAATRTFTSYQHYFEKNEFGLALQHVEKFFWHDFCDNYVELIKHQMFNPHEYTPEMVYATKWTLYHIELRILQLYAPYLPFITEEIYLDAYKSSHGVPSIHQTKFAAIQKPFDFSKSHTLMNHIIMVITQVRKAKSENQLSLKAIINNLHIRSLNSDVLQKIKHHEQLIKSITHVEHMYYHAEMVDLPLLLTHDDISEINVNI